MRTPRVHICQLLPFLVVVANVILDVLLAQKLGVIMLLEELIPATGIAMYWSFPREQRGWFRRLSLWYCICTLVVQSATQHMMRLPGAGIQVMAAMFLFMILSDIQLGYMVYVRIAATQPAAGIVRVLRSGLRVFSFAVVVCSAVGVRYGRKTDIGYAFVLTVFVLLCVGCVFFCIGLIIAVRGPIQALQKVQSAQLSETQRAIVSSALRVATLHQRVALATSTTTAILYIVMGIVFVTGSLDHIQDRLDNPTLSLVNSGAPTLVVAFTVNRLVNDLGVCILAFWTGPALSIGPCRRDLDTLEQLTAVGLLAYRLLWDVEDAASGVSFFVVEPGGAAQYVSRDEPPAWEPAAYPSTPIWLVEGGDVSSAKLSQARAVDGGAWAWEDVQPESGPMDGVYNFVACQGENFLRTAVLSHGALSRDAVVLMAGTLEVRKGVLVLWTNTSRFFCPPADVAMQAGLPLEKLWRFCPAGSVPTPGHDTILSFADGAFLERFLLERPDPIDPVETGALAGGEQLESSTTSIRQDYQYPPLVLEGIRAAIDAQLVLDAGESTLTMELGDTAHNAKIERVQG